MIFWAVILTIIYLFLNVLIWRKTHSVPLLLIQVLLYAYTFHGYLLVILCKFIPSLYIRISYFFNYPYYVSINPLFYLSYIFYCFFSIIYLAILFVMVPSASRQNKQQLQYLRIRVWPLVILGAFCFVAGVFFWYEALVSVLKSGKSAYLFFKRDGVGLGAWYPISRLLFDLSAMSLLLLMFVFVKTPIKVSFLHFEPVQVLIIVTLNVLLFSVLAAFGDKTSLFTGFLFATCITVVHTARLGRRLVYLLVAIIILNVITIIRHNPVDTSIFDILKASALSLLSHGETSATLSQYSIMNNNVKSFEGQSVIYIISALTPQLLYQFIPIFPQRSENPYTYFARSTGMLDNSGWGIHYASDWYMNFGWIGMIIGAVVLGLFHGYLYRKSCCLVAWRFVFYGYVAAFPLFIRSGMMGLKGAIYSMVLALLVYWVGFHKFHQIYTNFSNLEMKSSAGNYL